MTEPPVQEGMGEGPGGARFNCPRHSSLFEETLVDVGDLVRAREEMTCGNDPGHWLLQLTSKEISNGCSCEAAASAPYGPGH